MEEILLKDWMTSLEMPFGSKITSSMDDILHSHDFFEVFIMLDGPMEHELNGQRETLDCGDMRLILPFTDKHVFLRKNGSFKHRDIIIPNTLFKTVCGYLGANFYQDLISGKIPHKIHLNTDEIKDIERRITAIINFSGDKNSLHTLIIALTVKLLSFPVEKQYVSPLYSAWFEELMARFNMYKLVVEGLDKILEPFHFDRSYMCRVFKKNTGVSMTHYLNDVRLEYATTMLQSSDQSILSISQTLQFSSISYFNVTFKEKYGITPSRFRKKSQQ